MRRAILPDKRVRESFGLKLFPKFAFVRWRHLAENYNSGDACGRGVLGVVNPPASMYGTRGRGDQFCGGSCAGEASGDGGGLRPNGVSRLLLRCSPTALEIAKRRAPAAGHWSTGTRLAHARVAVLDHHNGLQLRRIPPLTCDHDGIGVPDRARGNRTRGARAFRLHAVDRCVPSEVVTTLLRLLAVPVRRGELRIRPRAPPPCFPCGWRCILRAIFRSGSRMYCVPATRSLITTT